MAPVTALSKKVQVQQARERSLSKSQSKTDSMSPKVATFSPHSRKARKAETIQNFSQAMQLAKKLKRVGSDNPLTNDFRGGSSINNDKFKSQYMNVHPINLNNMKLMKKRKMRQSGSSNGQAAGMQ